MIQIQVIQVANIAPQTTKEQMLTLFGFVGKIDDIRLYPTVDIGMQMTSKICFVKFYDSSCVSISQHLTNTVFIDRALVVIPFTENEIPDEQRGLELLTSGTLLPGIADPKLPQHVTSQLEGFPPHQVVATYDPKLAEASLPMYPPLPNNYEGRKLEEIRRTIMVANIDSDLNSQVILDHFNKCGEVKYFRLCTRDNDPLRYALIEFTEQPSILVALRQNGTKLGSKVVKVFHAIQAIVKPQAKTNEAAQKEIEDAMSRQAQTILSQGIDNMSTAVTPHLGAPVIKEKRRSRSRHRSNDRKRSGSRNRRRRSSSLRRVDYRYRSRSRERERVSRRRSRSRDHYKRRSSSGSLSRSKRSRSRSSRRDDKKLSSSKRHKDRKRDKDDKSSRDRGKDDKREHEKDDKKDRDRDERRDREKDEKRDREKDEKRDREKDEQRDREKDEKRDRDKDGRRDDRKDKDDRKDRKDRHDRRDKEEKKDKSKDKDRGNREQKTKEKERGTEELNHQNGKE